MSAVSPYADLVDRVRREVERNAVRARNGLKYVAGVDFTPPGPTPKDRVWRQGRAELWRYRNDDIRLGPPVLMFIGLVSRPTVFDLHAGSSLVQHFLRAGFDPYVLDWGIPTPADADDTIEIYVARYLPRAVRAVLRESQSDDVSVLGYCMGGNLALIAAGSDLDLPIRNLITLATPIDFTQVGPFTEPLRMGQLEPDVMIDSTGLLGPDYLRAFSTARKPTFDAAQYVRLWENLWNDEYVAGHQAMARWSKDHIPMPGAAFRQITESWLRGNAFVTGQLRLGGRPVDLKQVTAPTLSIVGLRDELVPAAAARPIDGLLGADDFTLLELDAGHIGLTVSRTASKVTIPTLLDWLERHSEPKEA